MKKANQFLNLLTMAIIVITLHSACGNKNNSSDSTASDNEDLSKMKQNVKNYICKNVIYFPESYEPLKFVVDTVYVNTELIAQKKEKEAALEKDKNSLASVEKFIKNYEKVDAMIKHPKDSDDPTNEESNAYGKGSIYYSKEKTHLENLKSEITNLPLQISELDKQIEQNKNVIKSYKVFHAYNAKDKENKLSVTEANIIIDKDYKVTNYQSASASKNSEESLSSNGSENWDKVLDDYEKFVDQYVILYKKTLAGDNSVLAESATLMEKAGDLEKSLKKAEQDKKFSIEQAARMLRIENKMLQAMQK